MTVVGCDNDKGKGCSDLSKGTECTAHSRCNNKFLCKTGQGNDSDCSSSCSCDG
jgi:hypothetical protein